MPGDAIAGAEPLLVNATYNKGRARRLHGAMQALNVDMTSQVKAGALARDTPRWRNWKRWINGYGAWFGSIPGGIMGAIEGWGTGGVAAMLDSYEREMIDWRNWYGRNFRTPPSGQYNPAGTEAGRPQGDGGAGIPNEVPAWVWGGIAVAGLFAAASLAKGLRR